MFVGRVFAGGESASAGMDGVCKAQSVLHYDRFSNIAQQEGQALHTWTIEDQIVIIIPSELLFEPVHILQQVSV